MTSASTLSRPSASVARVATRLESTPPLRPRTTRSKPTLRTSLRMKPTRMPLTSSGLIARGGKTVSERFAGALMPDPAEFVDRQFQVLVPEQGIRQPLPAYIAEVEAGNDQCLIGVLLLGDDVAVRTDHHGSTPEVCAVLVSHAIAVQEKACQELSVGSAEQAIGFRRPKTLIRCDAAPRAGGRTDDHVDALQAQDVGTRQVPDVLTDQHPGPAEARLDAAEPVAAGEIALLIEHAIGRQVDLAVQVDELAPTEIEAGV